MGKDTVDIKTGMTLVYCSTIIFKVQATQVHAGFFVSTVGGQHCIHL